MRLKDCEFEMLLPIFMRQQADDVAIARTLDPVIRDIGESVRLCSDWGVIDDLPEEILDALAWELDISWYDKEADIDVKRALIKSSDKVHAHCGTKAALIRIGEDYYGGAEVEEWFEYNGEPGHFKISVLSPDPHIKIPEEFIAKINDVKRQSAILDGIDFTWTNYQTIYAGTAQIQALRAPDIQVGAE